MIRLHGLARLYEFLFAFKTIQNLDDVMLLEGSPPRALKSDSTYFLTACAPCL